jgi:hypothetical protein
MCVIGMGLGGLILLAIFSMLIMAHKQEEEQDRLEIELHREKGFSFPGAREVSLDLICDFVTPDL